jgi:uncharacterized protein (TIGR00369 family)
MAQNDASDLQQWLADEERVLAGLAAGAGAQPLSPAEMIAKPGIEIFRAIFEGRLPPAPIGLTLDFLPIQVDPGFAVFQGRPQERHYNPMGTVHGGWFATLLDSALGCAVHSALPAGKAYTTLELKLNLVRALTADVPRVRAEGKIIHLGGQTATAEARLLGPDGKLYAHGTTTCLIFSARPR